MRKLFALLLVCTAIISCNKKDIAPITGYNSRIDIDSVYFHGMSIAEGITGYLRRDYLIGTDSTPVNMAYLDSFAITQNGFSQQFHFNTPPNAINCTVQLKLMIYEGFASSVTVNKLVYYKNQEAIFTKKPLEMSGVIDSFFSAAHMITF